MSTKNKKTSSISANAVLDEFLESLTFGEFVKHMRESDNVTQTELARRLEVSKQFVYAIEKNKKRVSVDVAKEIAAALGYSAEAFVKILLNDFLSDAGINKVVELKPRKKVA